MGSQRVKRDCATNALSLITTPFFFNFYFYFILLYNTVLVLPYIDMNPPRVYTCSPSWTSLPLRSPYHLSRSSQCTSPEHPVSCIEPGLVIHFTYDIIHVSMPFSQIMPPSPSPTESKRLFYTSLYCFFILHFTMTNDDEHHSCLFTICQFPLMRNLFRYFVDF